MNFVLKFPHLFTAFVLLTNFMVTQSKIDFWETTEIKVEEITLVGMAPSVLTVEKKAKKSTDLISFVSGFTCQLSATTFSEVKVHYSVPFIDRYFFGFTARPPPIGLT